MESNSEHPYKAPKGKIWKTDGNCDWVLVDDLDSYNEDGSYKKNRKVRTHITPKKKKRKKR